MNDLWETMIGIIMTASTGVLIAMGVAIRQWVFNRNALIKERAEKCKSENIIALQAIIRGFVRNAEDVYPPKSGIQKLEQVLQATQQICEQANIEYNKDWVERYIKEIVDFSKLVNVSKLKKAELVPLTINKTTVVRPRPKL